MAVSLTTTTTHAQSRRELQAKSAGGAWARMWRTAACAEAKAPSCPSAVRVGRDRVLLLFSADADGPDRRALFLSESTDSGKTWSTHRTVYNSVTGKPRALGTLTRLQSGKLVAPFNDGDGSVRVLVSEDDGEVWSVRATVDCAPLQEATPYGQLVETGGELLMPVHGAMAVGEKAGPCSGLLRSRDGGETWGSFTEIACDREQAKVEYGPTAIHAVPSGSILALISADRRFLYRSVSHDKGKTWSPPEQRLLACNPALAAVGTTLACANQDTQVRGVVRVQFSDNLFDSWRCDRMLDQEIKGEFLSLVALDDDRLLLVHGRGDFKHEGRGTRVAAGIEVAMMQRNPAEPATPKSLVPADRRDDWVVSKRSTVPFPSGGGEMSVAGDGRLLAWSGGRIHASNDEGTTFHELSSAPEGTYNAGVFGVARSGRWLVATTDWSGVSDADWRGKRVSLGRPDGYEYFKMSGVKGVSVVRTYYSDDEGGTWHGGERPMDPAPLVWANPYGRFLELSEGTVLMTAYGCLSHEDTSGRIDCCGVYRSTDGGASWGDFSAVAYDDAEKEIAYNEMDVQPMPDGTLVAVIRTEWRNHSGGEASSSSVCFSRDDGKTWTKPEFAFIGAVPALALLPDGGLVCATSFSKLRFSYDGGHTWSLELPSLTRHYPGVQVLGKGGILYVHDRWRNNRVTFYERSPSRTTGPR